MRIFAISVCLIFAACVMDDEQRPDEKSSKVSPSVASVHLAEDCPDPDQAPAKAAEAAPGDSSHPGPCSQSSLQLSFSGTVSAPSRVTIRGVRLLGDDGQVLGTLTSRTPTLWKAKGYQAWDGLLPAAPDQKASYKLSAPDWAAVERRIGGSSFGRMYRLEVDVEVEGKTTTVRSASFQRVRPAAIPT